MGVLRETGSLRDIAPLVDRSSEMELRPLMAFLCVLHVSGGEGAGVDGGFGLGSL